MLQLKKEEVDTPEKRGKYRLNVVGCGQKGVFYALAFAEAGFKVSCTDVDQSAVKRVSTGSLPFGDRPVEIRLKSLLRKGLLSVADDFDAAVSESDITIIAVGADVDSKKGVDNGGVVGICKKVGKAIRKGALVVFGGVGGVGFVESVVKETLENTSGFKAGEDLGVAYHPTFNSPQNIEKKNGVQEAIVAASDKYSLNSAALIFEAIAEKGVKKSSSIKTAEAAVLFAAAKQDINMAVNNELAMFCENAGLDLVETATLFDNFLCINSSAPTIAEEANRDEVYVLLDNAENSNIQLRLSRMARQQNEYMVKHAFDLTQEALRAGGKTMRRAKIALLGAAETGTAAGVFVELLVTKGAKISRYDPSRYVKAEGTVLKRTLNETAEGADCLIILSEQEQFKRLNLKKIHALMKEPAAFVDLAGVVEPSKVENAGFMYKGLGRGDRQK